MYFEDKPGAGEEVNYPWLFFTASLPESQLSYTFEGTVLIWNNSIYISDKIPLYNGVMLEAVLLTPS